MTLHHGITICTACYDIRAIGPARVCCREFFTDIGSRIVTVNLKQQFLKPLAHAIYNRGPFGGLASYFQVVRELREYRRLSSEHIPLRNFSPWPIDRYDQAGEAGMYFYQDSWCATHIREALPALHVDVGSSMMFVAMVLQLCELLYIDVRPITINSPRFRFQRGDLMTLPIESRSVESISSLSVVEHVGLGRYGDALDACGTDKACAELARVLRPGGRLYVAVPIAVENSTHFNAHRIFCPESFMAKFPALSIVDEKYALADRVIGRAEYDKINRPYAFGCFALTTE